MTHAIKDYLLVEVPEDAPSDPQRYGIVHIFHGEDLLYYSDDKGETVPIANVGATGYQIVALSDVITEEQCKEIVKKGFEDSDTWDSGTQYSRTETWTTYWCYEAGEYSLPTTLESFQSLLKSLNLKGAAVLKKNQ